MSTYTSKIPPFCSIKRRLSKTESQCFSILSRFVLLIPNNNLQISLVIQRGPWSSYIILTTRLDPHVNSKHHYLNFILVHLTNITRSRYTLTGPCTSSTSQPKLVLIPKRSVYTSFSLHSLNPSVVVLSLKSWLEVLGSTHSSLHSCTSTATCYSFHHLYCLAQFLINSVLISFTGLTTLHHQSLTLRT